MSILSKVSSAGLGAFNKIKSNKAINGVVSNLTQDTDEVLGNIRGMHKKNFRRNRQTQSNIKKGIKNDLYESGDDLLKAKSEFARAEKAASMSKDYLNMANGITEDTLSKMGVSAREYQDTNIRNIFLGNKNKELSDLDMFDKAQIFGEKINQYYNGAGVSDAKRNTRIGATIGAGVLGASGVGIGASYLNNRKKEFRY